MNRALSQYMEITDAAGMRPTFPITAILLARHAALIRSYAARGAEFAIHGMVHGDHRDQTLDEQLPNFAEAMRRFQATGIPYVGFRAPYLRANEATDRALRELGFAYNSSRAIGFPVLTGALGSGGQREYERVLAYYDAQDAQVTVSRPRDIGGLVQIPVAVPDDELLVDRLRQDDEAQKRAWLAILDRTYQRNELFTILLHPERIFKSGPALRAVLEEARCRTPGVWLASLGEIASWWVARRQVRLAINSNGPDRYGVEVTGDPRASIIVRNVTVAASRPWHGDEAIASGPRFDVASRLKPIVGVSTRSPGGVVPFLSEEGYAVEVADDAGAFGAYVDVDETWQEQSVLELIDQAQGPVIRLARWPDAARSAIAVTGDIDSITLQDFAVRLYETSTIERRRRLKRLSESGYQVRPA